MAALSIFTDDDRHGVVFVRDERSDGTVVTLTCTAGGDGGVPTPSHPPGEEEKWYPLVDQAFSEVKQRTKVRDQFVLTIDTSELPSGKLSFDLNRFVEQAGNAADAGERTVVLDPGRAKEWGLGAKRRPRRKRGRRRVVEW